MKLNRASRTRLFVLAIAPIGITTAIARGGDISWANSHGGDFARANNWSPRAIPGAGDRAIFDIVAGPAGSYTVSFGGGAISNTSALVRQDEVFWDLGGGTYTLSNSADSLLVGNPTANTPTTLQISNGRLNTSAVSVGGAPFSLSTSMYIDPTATWVNTGSVQIGRNNGALGSGWLASAGTSTIDGPVLIGRDGYGFFTASGNLHTTDTQIGLSTNGDAQVSGVGAVWTNSGSMLVGAGTFGSLTVDNGATLNCADVEVRRGSAFLKATNLGAAVWNVTGSFRSGTQYNVNCSLNIASFTTLNTSSARLGDGGQIGVTLDGTWNNTGTLVVGDGALGFGLATIQINSTGQLNGVSVAKIGFNSGGGHILVGNGWSVSDHIEIGSGGSLSVGFGQTMNSPNPIIIQNGGGISVNYAALNTPSVDITGSGNITGAGSFNAPIHTDGSVFLAPGLELSFQPQTLSLPQALVVSGSNNQVVKIGPGTLSIAGSQSYSPTTTFICSNGTTIFATDCGGGGANLRIVAEPDDGPANITFGATQHVDALTVGRPVSAYGATATLEAGGDKLLVTHRLNMQPNGVLDVTDNAAVVDYTIDQLQPTSPLNAIATSVASAYAGGSRNGAGITSSMADASHFTVGYAEAASIGLTSFRGESLDATAVVLSYTRFGDANLDGSVDTVDFNLLAANFSQPGQYWFNGDFNYDGSVDTTDFNLLASNFGHSLPAASAAVGAFVPEPAAWSLALGASAFFARRRRVIRGKYDASAAR
jgi:T5SS/PEP-CTERM-associated repeat protein